MATIPFPGPETRVMIMNEKAQAMPDDTDDTEIHPLFAGAPSSTEFRKLRKRLVRETRAAIEAIKVETGAQGMKDMGKVMAWLKPKINGRADMGLVSSAVKQRLNS